MNQQYSNHMLANNDNIPLHSTGYSLVKHIKSLLSKIILNLDQSTLIVKLYQPIVFQIIININQIFQNKSDLIR